MTMRLHGYWRSGAAYRVRTALNLKGLTAEAVPVSLKSGAQHAPAFRALNPQGLVPAIEAGGAVLTQSLAIIEWLDETHPAPPLLPADAVARARVRGFAQIIACDTHPLQNLRALEYLRGPLAQPEDAVAIWARHWMTEGLAACEAIAAGQPGPFAFGDAPGLADICLIPQLYTARRFGLDPAAWPRLAGIEAACAALPAFANAHPARQPDAG